MHLFSSGIGIARVILKMARFVCGERLFRAYFSEGLAVDFEVEFYDYISLRS